MRFLGFCFLLTVLCSCAVTRTGAAQDFKHVEIIDFNSRPCNGTVLKSIDIIGAVGDFTCRAVSSDLEAYERGFQGYKLFCGPDNRVTLSLYSDRGCQTEIWTYGNGVNKGCNNYAIRPGAGEKDWKRYSWFGCCADTKSDDCDYMKQVKGADYTPPYYPTPSPISRSSSLQSAQPIFLLLALLTIAHAIVQRT